MGKRETLVECAQKYIGCNESDGTHKQIIDIYNSQETLPRSYKVQYTDAWCATFVSAMAILAECTDIIPTECSCNYMITGFKELGEWVEDDSYTPAVGDIIFYDWSDSGSGDCTGSADHVGIVESVSGTTITVIEGNKNDAVGRRTMTVNGQYIRGYGVPAYPGDEEEIKVGWSEEADGWRYYLSDGTMVINGWVQDEDGGWYWFRGDGLMVTDTWYYYNDAWYYLGSDGAMLTGQQTIDGKWYVLDDSGAMINEPVVLTPDDDGAMIYTGLAC